MKYVKLFEQFILTETNSGERVAIFPGRFMPVHNGHIEAFEKTSYEFDRIKVIPIQIVRPGPDSPFPIDLLERIGKAVVGEYRGLLADWIIFPQGIKTVIPQMAKVVMENGYDPVAMGCGADRYNDYKRQVDYLLSPKSDVKVNEFALESVMSRDEDGPSGTKVRETLKSGTKKDFEKLVPKSVWPFYEELKTYIK
jgi:cytidyltransferase-like protein